MLCGEMGLPLVQFYEMTPRQFQNYATGFIDQKESSRKQSWEQARFIAYWSASMGLKKSTKPKDLLSFDWDVEPQMQQAPQMPTEDEINASKEFWEKIDQKRGESGN